MKWIFVFFIAIIAVTGSASSPPRFKVCSRNDSHLSDCMNEAAVTAITALANGDKDLGLDPLDPLSVKYFSLSDNSLEQTYENIKIHGLTKNLEVSGYDIDFDNLIFKSTSFNPQVDFVADYTLDGQLLLFPIRGHGRSNITMLNLKTENIFYGERVEKAGQQYLKIKHYEISFFPEKVLMNFSNLFDGNFVLAPAAGYFIKNNADSLFQEMREPFEKFFATTFRKLGNKGFSKVPFNQIFPEV